MKYKLVKTDNIPKEAYEDLFEPTCYYCAFSANIKYYDGKSNCTKPSSEKRSCTQIDKSIDEILWHFIKDISLPSNTTTI